MQHSMLDGSQGYRSRFDDIQLIQEILEEVPEKLGLASAMPAFLLPYYNGVVPEDSGISAFVFLHGGHFTLHTFSFREVYFADLVASTPYDAERLHQLLKTSLPCESTAMTTVSRDQPLPHLATPDSTGDFGPHVLLEIGEYAGPSSLDELFEVFDCLPASIQMTPIMRPYLLKGITPDGRRYISALTMIAESHISVHIYPDEHRAYFDLFSCQFFDATKVFAQLKKTFPGSVIHEAVLGRGNKYQSCRTTRENEVARKHQWTQRLAAMQGSLTAR